MNEKEKKLNTNTTKSTTTNHFLALYDDVKLLASAVVAAEAINVTVRELYHEGTAYNAEPLRFAWSVNENSYNVFSAGINDVTFMCCTVHQKTRNEQRSMISSERECLPGSF